MTAGCLWVVRKYTSPYASNADASGYLNHARLLLAGTNHLPLTPLAPREAGWQPAVQQPLGFVLAPGDAALVPSYPVGYPLLLILGAWAVGLDWATVAVNVVLAAGSGLLLFHLGRRWGLPTPWALAGVAVLWASPLFIYLSTQPMSDVAAMVAVMAAVAAAQRGRDTASLGWMAAAGVATGIAVLIRPTNLLVAFPLAWLFRGSPRAWLAWIAGGVPAACFLMWHQAQLYGHPFLTGYGGDSLWRFFRLDYAPGGLRHFALGLGLHLSPWLAAGILGLPWRRIPERGLFLTWIGAFVGFYAFYWFSTGNWWFLRFILPAFPAIIIGSLLVWRTLVQKVRPPAAAVVVALVVLVGTLGWQVRTSDRHYALIMKRGERVYADSSRWIDAHTPADAIVLATQTSGALTYYTDRTLVRPDLLSATETALLFDVVRRTGRPLFAITFGSEIDAARPKVGGEWVRSVQFGIITIWRITPPPAPAT